MINIRDKQDCCGCHACYNSCPQNCITMQSDSEGFWYPVVDLEKCTDCGLCERVCPIVSKRVIENHPAAYACINRDEEIRQQSSSGGVFSVVAKSVIANQGVVFGAGFEDDFTVVHSWTDSLEGLCKYRGAKYVQSCIGDTYRLVGDFLKQERQVLFTGTPCQISGLRSYLGEAYEGLLCLDIICHGVPSPLVWEKYRSTMANEKQLMSIRFRDKAFGWRKYSIVFEFCDGAIIRELGSKNKYIQGFVKNFYLRPSCYNCSFKSINCQSDMTLADFWGVKNILPSFDDDRGTSLILINSKKGAEVFASLADKVECKQVDVEQALIYNSSAVSSAAYNPKRNQFFKEFSDTEDSNQLIAKYVKVSFSKTMYIMVRTLLSEMKRKMLSWKRD